MKDSGKFGKAIGEKLAGFEAWVLGHLGANGALTPKRFKVWLEEHGFVRQENNQPVADYAGFTRWIRNGLFALLGWVLCFELYTIVLGTFNEDPRSLGLALAAGVLLFGGSWLLWLYRTIGRTNPGLAWVYAAFSTLVAVILIGMPTYQYYHPHPLPLISQIEVQNLLGGGIPRLWSILGFVFMSAAVLPLAWTARLGPAFLSLAFTKVPQEIKKTISDIIDSFRGNTQAREQLDEYAEVPTGLLLAVSAILALFTLSLQMSPTVWGPYGGALIAVTSIVVLWIRKTNSFLGNFLTKALYGVATGGLLFISFAYGLCLVTLMLLSAWAASKLLFSLLALSFLVGLGSAILVLFNSTTAAEQNELARGKGHIQPYTRRYKGTRTDGQPDYDAIYRQTRKFSFAWLQSPILWVALAVAGFLVWTEGLGHPNPLSGIDWFGYNTLIIAVVVCAVLAWLFDNGTETVEAEEAEAPAQHQQHTH